MENNLDEATEVIEEGINLNPEWMHIYENRKEVEVDIGGYRGKLLKWLLDSLNHCVMDSLVLLANEEDMLKIMHSYGIENLFQIINFQRYNSETSEDIKKLSYKSFMGDTKLSEKVTIGKVSILNWYIVLNQIIAVMGHEGEKLKAEQLEHKKEMADPVIEEEGQKKHNQEEAKE